MAVRRSTHPPRVPGQTGRTVIVQSRLNLEDLLPCITSYEPRPYWQEFPRLSPSRDTAQCPRLGRGAPPGFRPRRIPHSESTGALQPMRRWRKTTTSPARLCASNGSPVGTGDCLARAAFIRDPAFGDSSRISGRIATLTVDWVRKPMRILRPVQRRWIGIV